jgi:divalent metal cation (Fe/Co/Zn/Cd) transporter
MTPASELVPPSERRITPEEGAEERALFFAIVADALILIAMGLSGIYGGSLTMVAETIRGVLMALIEVFAYALMRRIHRGMQSDLEFGIGKLEQVGNLAIGIGMLASAAWIASKAVAMIAGERALGTPIGLAFAAVFGAVNMLINLLAWDGMRRAARAESSLVMLVQLKSRMIKLVSSFVVLLAMTIAAVVTDEVVTAWADALGSLFVTGFIVINALRTVQASMFDLLDRSAGAPVRAAVERVLARHDAAFARLERLRSRRSGRTVFVEVALTFDPGLTMAEVNRRVEEIRQALLGEIEHGDIAIVASSSPS